MTSRAFTSINLLDLACPYCAPGGKVIYMKGRRANIEITQWKELSLDSPFKMTEIIETALPFTDTLRKLLLFTKG